MRSNASRANAIDRVILHLPGSLDHGTRAGGAEREWRRPLLPEVCSFPLPCCFLGSVSSSEGGSSMYLWWEQRCPVGTKLRVLSSPVHHEGTYVGHLGENGEDVIHSDKPDGVILSHFDEFAEHWPVQ